MPASSSCMQTADLIVHGSPAGQWGRVSVLDIAGIEQPPVAKMAVIIMACNPTQGKGWTNQCNYTLL